MRPGKRLAKSTPKEKLMDALAHPFNVSTFLGALLVAVTAGVIVPRLNNMLDNANSTNTPDTAIHSDAISENIPSNEIATSSTPSVNAISNDDTPSDSVSNGTVSSNPTLSDIALNDTISNGTTPKGTAPKIIPMTEEMMEILSSIQRLSIGCSKDWVDNELGKPFSEENIAIGEERRLYPGADESSKVGEILECVYIYDIVAVQVYFDVPNNSCKAFFITLLEDTFIDIVIPQVYSSLVSNKPIGEFTYSEISGEPDYVYGYAGQGISRAFYGEKYYFAALGNYQNFYFANLDYGMLNSLASFIHFLSVVQFDINPSTDTAGPPVSDLLIQEREGFYPNTYGISALNVQLTFSLLGSYAGFDSLPLRGWD